MRRYCRCNPAELLFCCKPCSAAYPLISSPMHISRVGVVQGHIHAGRTSARSRLQRCRRSVYLPISDAGMLSGVNHECAADPERARWALLGICRADQQNENGAHRNGAAHDSFAGRSLDRQR